VLVEIGREFWGVKAFVTRQRLLYSVMDFGEFEQAEGSVICKGWVPRRFAGDLAELCRRAQQSSGSAVPIEVRLSWAKLIMDVH
jgi:hypothetical protein